MKGRPALILVVVVAAFLLLWWLHARQRPAQSGSSAQAPVAPASGAQTAQTRDVPSAVHSAVQALQEIPARVEQRRKHAANERVYDEWRTPIEFYGKVVDENAIPVPNAQIDFDCNDLSANGTSYYHSQSDADGMFSINNIQGKLLGVKVKKEGYYSYLPLGDNFYYAGENVNFEPDKNKPVVFRLRRKGLAERLILLRRNYKLPRDGTPLAIDLTTGVSTTSSNGSFIVQCWTDDQGKPAGQRYSWRCLLTIPTGGFSLSDERFPFLAPEGGYVATTEIAMPSDRADWKSEVPLSFFYRLGEGLYGRMRFSVIAGGDHFCTVESYLNPSRSRNLEFDPNNVIRPSR